MNLPLQTPGANLSFDFPHDEERIAVGVELPFHLLQRRGQRAIFFPILFQRFRNGISFTHYALTHPSWHGLEEFPFAVEHHQYTIIL